MVDCVLCHEPIWSFICGDCIKTGVRAWLPPALVPPFEQFQETLAHGMERHAEGMHCVRCGKVKPAALDWYCAMNEIAQWLGHEDAALGSRLAELLPIKDSTATELHGVRLKPTATPLSEGEEPLDRVEFGICDECGDYSDELQQIANEWVCSRCLAAE